VKSVTDLQYWGAVLPLHCALDDKSCALAKTANVVWTERRDIRETIIRAARAGRH
jgi:hypothetical protein